MNPAARNEFTRSRTALLLSGGGGGGGGVGPGAYERGTVQESCLQRMYNLKSSPVFDTTNPERVRNVQTPQLNANQRRGVRPDLRAEFQRHRSSHQSYSGWGIGG